ncbi:hypothetical protein FHR07_09775 [Serratia ureilytica]|nr:hypothetical protein [Serratia ureilytica]
MSPSYADKGEKAWFFPLCDEQPKINKLIFLVFICFAGVKSGNVGRRIPHFKGSHREPLIFTV